MLTSVWLVSAAHTFWDPQCGVNSCLIATHNYLLTIFGQYLQLDNIYHLRCFPIPDVKSALPKYTNRFASAGATAGVVAGVALLLALLVLVLFLHRHPTPTHLTEEVGSDQVQRLSRNTTTYTWGGVLGDQTRGSPHFRAARPRLELSLDMSTCSKINRILNCIRIEGLPCSWIFISWVGH